jgi:uncharacterized protein (TIGR02246 family)
MKTHPILTGAVFCLLSSGLSGEGAPEAMDTAGRLIGSYAEAFNSGDPAAVAAFYSEDVHYTDEQGGTLDGRAAVDKTLRVAFSRQKGAKLEFEIQRARMLGKNVLTVEAISAVIFPDNGREFSRSELTWLRDGDAWRIAEAADRFMVDPDIGQQALSQLAWMEGTWKDDVAGTTVETRVTWTPGRRFLTRSFTVTEEGGGPVESTEIIGFDPILGVIRSWNFDNAGGFGEGLWIREGDRWSIRAKSTLPSGGTASAQHVIRRIDDDRFSWQSVSRTIDGNALPNLDKIEVVRVRKAAGSNE